MTVRQPFFERPWSCRRCGSPRRYVTKEIGASSTIEYEVVICASCAHADTRAAKLDAVAALSLGGQHDVRLIEPRAAAPSRSHAIGAGAPQVADAPPIAPRPESTATVSEAYAVSPPTLGSVPLVSPFGTSQVLDRVAGELRAKLATAKKAERSPSIGVFLTILMVTTGMGIGAWLLFGQAATRAVPPAPLVAVPAASDESSAPTVAVTAASAPRVLDFPGDPHAIDPGALIGEARGVCGLGQNGVLTEIQAVFVGSNGKVDLDNPYYKGWVKYTFESVTDAPPAPARPEGVPLGAPGTPAPRSPTYRSRDVVVSIDGFHNVEWRVRPLGRDEQVEHPVPPHCSFAQIWEAARSGDAPADAVATVKYSVRRDRPSWWFVIENTPFGFSINPETCTRY